ncbi:uncharacterized protein METZ01_LOCUS303614, partial [marine metagenome]
FSKNARRRQEIEDMKTKPLTFLLSHFSVKETAFIF